MRPLLHLLVFVTAGLTGVALQRGGWWVVAPFAFVFALLPVVDFLVGVDTENRTPRGPRWLWDLPLAAWVPVQIGLSLAVLAAVAEARHGLAETLAIVAALGLANGSGGINVAHELMHRPGRAHRAVAELLMTWVSYPHFCVEHVRGHHRRVATPADPATARLGESLPAFLLRGLAGGLRSAWRLEAERADREGRGPWTLADARLRQPLLLACLWTAVLAAYGAAGLAAFLTQGLVAVLLLESINYVEHYGLRRREVAPGRFERVGPEHSWNSPRRVSNGYLFNLERHSDHHELASRPYERLRHRPEAPQLPAGYSWMLLLAWVPPLWFRLMDPRVSEAGRPR